MITEDYVSFEIAKLLKEKGFPQTILSANNYFKRNTYKIDGKLMTADENLSVPTIALAMKWLREQEWFICIIPLAFYCGEKASKFGYNIWAGDNLEVDEFSTPKFNTYKEACEAAIKYCLKNLI